MKVRLGYACLNNNLNTSYNNYTYTTFKKELDFIKLNSKIKNNLNTLDKTIDFNIKNNLHFFRITSSLIPLATREDVNNKYLDNFKKEFEVISKKIIKSNMRVDFHPDQFCIINSTNENVFISSLNILEYHYDLLKALNIKNKLMIIHIGSSTNGKEEAINRFINGFNKLPKHLRKCIVIENDDKIFNVKDCLYISDKLNIPFVFDYHHHICNPVPNVENYMENILKTWKTIPKMHFSSPKNETKREFRSHNDFINCDEFIVFLNLMRKYNIDIDVMIEAKAKDEALFKLISDLKLKTNYEFIDESTFIVK